jgi:hypothetical protein
MTKQSGFKEAALLAQETAAAEEEGELKAKIFIMLQGQHDKQIAAMTATNKANMDVMIDRMNALVAGSGGDRRTPIQQPDKENTQTRGKYMPPNKLGLEQETQETKSSLSPLQKNCPPQTTQLLQT